jgi:uncharacterized protein (DUF433 family)
MPVKLQIDREADVCRAVAPGIAPETIPVHLPHLTLAQVFDALSYYSDHQEAINQYIAQNQVPDTLIDPLL